MSILTGIKKLSNESKRLLAIRTVGWGLPLTLIPLLRFVEDKDKKPSLRKELFFRDFASYFVGTGIYFGALYGALKAFKSPAIKKLSKNIKMIAPEIIATTSFCLWSGVIAPKLSKKTFKRKELDTQCCQKPTLHICTSIPLEYDRVNFSKNLNYRQHKLYTSNTYSRFRV
ncbi:MAG: hypothetical protein PHE56_16575 [Bacteroidales bacterium]|nr:hypothetical protein [Bacteroidales bacterium]